MNTQVETYKNEINTLQGLIQKRQKRIDTFESFDRQEKARQDSVNKQNELRSFQYGGDDNNQYENLFNLQSIEKDTRRDDVSVAQSTASGGRRSRKGMIKSGQSKRSQTSRNNSRFKSKDNDNQIVADYI